MNGYNSVVSVLYYYLMSIYCSSVLHNNKLNYMKVIVMLTCSLTVKRRLQLFSHKRDLLRNTLCSPRGCLLDTPVVLFLSSSLQCQMPLNKSSALCILARPLATSCQNLYVNLFIFQFYLTEEFQTNSNSKTRFAYFNNSYNVSCSH